MKSLENALTNIRRTPYQAIIAILITSITFFVAYIFTLFLIGAEEVLKFFETRPQVIAFFEINSSLEEIKQVDAQLSEKDFVKETKLVSKEEALNIYKEDNKENPLLLELVTADILPASIEASAYQAEDLSLIKKELEEYEVVEEVILQQDIIDSLNKWTQGIRSLGIITTTLLAISSFLIMFVIISLKVANRKKAIGIMRIIGAGKHFILTPFMYESIIYFFLGSTIGFGLMYSLYLYATPFLKDFLMGIIHLPLDWQIFAWIAGVGTMISIIWGILTSILAVNKLIKK